MHVLIAETQNGVILWQVENIHGRTLCLDGVEYKPERQILPAVPVEAEVKKIVRIETAITIGDKRYSKDEGYAIISAKKAECGVTTDDVGDEEFPSLEAEFEWRKFCQTLGREYEEVPVYKPVKVVCMRVFDPESRWIHCLPCYNNNLSFDHIATGEYFTFDPDPVAMMHEVCGKLGLVYDGEEGKKPTDGKFHYSIPSHSGLEFMQINGHYMQAKHLNRGSCQFLTYEAARAKETDYFKELHRAVVQKMAELSMDRLDKNSVGHVVSTLQRICTMAGKVETTRKSQCTGGDIIKLASGLIAALVSPEEDKT